MKAENTRPLYQIAREIKSDWKKPSYCAVPYLRAMADLQSVNDSYGFDTGKGIVRYFLCNASQWKGETAKRIKAELKGLVK